MIDVTSSKYLHKYSSSHQKSAATKAALYLSSAFVNDMSRGNPDVIDRRSRGLQRPWDSQGRHVSILNKPEQLRGPLSPYCKAGTQSGEARVPLQLVTAWMPDGMRRYLRVLDIQDSCCPLFFPQPLIEEAMELAKSALPRRSSVWDVVGRSAEN